MTRPGAHRLAPWALALSAYVTLAIVATWPLVIRLTSAVPHDTGDPLLSTWLLWWNAHAVPLSARWWDAPMFWPLKGTLALSEHLLGLSLFATPMQWLGAAPITAYNTLFVASFPLCAIAAHALAHEITARHDAAAVAGLAYGFNPYRLSQISHVQMLWVFWTPLALLALHRYARDGGRRWLILFAAMWLGQALSNTYFLIFLPILLALWTLWFLTAGRPIRAAAAAAAWGGATLLLLPIVVRYSQVNARFAVERTYDEVRLFSAPVDALFSPSALTTASAFLRQTGNAEQQLFPGVAILLLVVVAAATAALDRRAPSARRTSLTRGLWCAAAASLAVGAVSPVVGPWQLRIGSATILSVASATKPLTVALWCAAFSIVSSAAAARAWAARSAFAFYALAALAMYALSLGPEPTILGLPFWYRAPYAWLLEVPGFSNVRVPARFAMLGILCLAVAAAIAFARLRARMPPRASAAFVVVVLGIAVADAWVRIPLVNLPPRLDATAIPDDAVVAELPLGAMVYDSAALYRSMFHECQLVNGYSGFEPVHYTILREALDAGDADALEPMAFKRPIAVVEQAGGRISMRAAAQGARTIRRGAALRIQSAAASSGTIDAAALADDDRRSFWESGAPQCGTEWLTIDLGALHGVDALVMSLGGRLHDYPRSLAIDASDDGRAWNTVWSGRTAARAVAGALDDPAMIPLTFELAGIHARWLRLRQTGSDAHAHWSVAELRVFGE